MGQPGPDQLTFTLRASGAWAVAGAAEDRRGCLDREQLSHFAQALADADFTPPKPPDVTCAAVPDEFVTARDVGRNRSAHWSGPCGTDANPDVTALATAVRSFAGALEVPLPAPPLPPVLTCDPGAPELYVESVHRAPQQRQSLAELTIRSSGAWTLTSAGSATSTGCVRTEDLVAFRRALALSDFTPPPPPRIQCKAIPTRFVTYRDVPGRRTASSSNPCGRAASEDVRALSALAHQLTSGPAPAPTPPAPPQACRPAGKPLYDLRVEPIIHDQRAMLPPATEMVTVYATGFWTRAQSGTRSSGCLTKAQVNALERAAASARLKRAAGNVHCRALPNSKLTLTLRKGSYRWTAPCGSDAPHESVSLLIDRVERMLAAAK